MTETMVKTAVRALDAKKAHDLCVLRVEHVTTLADYFVLATGTSTTQVGALADECEVKMAEAGYTVSHREGREAGNWVLLDYGDIIVHVFGRETREFYGLERFWKDAEEMDVKTYLEA